MFCAGVAAGFNAPISGVFFAVESVLQRPGAKDDLGVTMDSSVTANSSGLTIAMVLLASVVAAVVSQVRDQLCFCVLLCAGGVAHAVGLETLQWRICLLLGRGPEVYAFAHL